MNRPSVSWKAVVACSGSAALLICILKMDSNQIAWTLNHLIDTIGPGKFVEKPGFKVSVIDGNKTSTTNQSA